MMIGLQGKMGTGKTLTMTVLGIYLSIRTQTPLYANYTIKTYPSKRIRSSTDLWDANHGIVLLDEAWLTLDSRLYNDNVKLTRWINQTRKKDLILLYTTQHIRQIELRMRNATDILINMSKETRGHWLQFIDWQYRELGRRYLLPNPKKFWGLYDTYEVLEPLKIAKEHQATQTRFDRR